ncbi:hypothetical protein GWI33_011964 [Rhynchophorus ferrugineus]|uniref:Uncharacterized protein n=1 Tax=Rhynchophorus ferrugineus TaxID=354439 RepID=A0A834IWB1_RHYFE|nr:hypothetical protein GWI33_011964 [Rhynchophorus ferrugineus]
MVDDRPTRTVDTFIEIPNDDKSMQQRFASQINRCSFFPSLCGEIGVAYAVFVPFGQFASVNGMTGDENDKFVLDRCADFALWSAIDIKSCPSLCFCRRRSPTDVPDRRVPFVNNIRRSSALPYLTTTTPTTPPDATMKLGKLDGPDAAVPNPYTCVQKHLGSACCSCAPLPPSTPPPPPRLSHALLVSDPVPAPSFPLSPSSFSRRCSSSASYTAAFSIRTLHPGTARRSIVLLSIQQ